MLTIIGLKRRYWVPSRESWEWWAKDPWWLATSPHSSSAIHNNLSTSCLWGGRVAYSTTFSLILPSSPMMSSSVKLWPSQRNWKCVFSLQWGHGQDDWPGEAESETEGGHVCVSGHQLHVHCILQEHTKQKHPQPCTFSLIRDVCVRAHNKQMLYYDPLQWQCTKPDKTLYGGMQQDSDRGIPLTLESKAKRK